MCSSSDGDRDVCMTRLTHMRHDSFIGGMEMLCCVCVLDGQCVLQCNVLRCAAKCCIVLQCVDCGALCCNVLKCAVVCCSMLQCGAVW